MGNDLEQALKDKTLDDIIHALPCSHPIQEEIDRLKAKLEEAHTELAISIKERIDLGGQLAEARTKLTIWPDIFDENMRLATANDTLRDQLAEAMAENKALQASLLAAGEAYSEARQDVAMQIIQYIIDQGFIDAGTIARPMLVYEIAECDITELKKRYGLEVSNEWYY